MNTQVYWPCILAALKQGHFIHIGAFGGLANLEEGVLLPERRQRHTNLTDRQGFLPLQRIVSGKYPSGKGGKMFYLMIPQQISQHLRNRNRDSTANLRRTMAILVVAKIIVIVTSVGSLIPWHGMWPE